MVLNRFWQKAASLQWLNYCLLFFILLLNDGCSAPTQPKLRPLAKGATILAFGDSLTFGTGATANANYPAVLELITGYHVVNAGVPGEETKEGVKRINTLLEQIEPQLVLLCLGGNDMLRKRPHSSIKQNLKTIISLIKQFGAQIVLIAVPEPKIRMLVPNFYSELGQELNIPVEMTVLPSLLSNNKFKSDYIHLNDAGYRELAIKLAEFLKQQGAISIAVSSAPQPA